MASNPHTLISCVERLVSYAALYCVQNSVENWSTVTALRLIECENPWAVFDDDSDLYRHLVEVRDN